MKLHIRRNGLTPPKNIPCHIRKVAEGIIVNTPTPYCIILKNKKKYW